MVEQERMYRWEQREKKKGRKGRGKTSSSACWLFQSGCEKRRSFRNGCGRGEEWEESFVVICGSSFVGVSGVAHIVRSYRSIQLRSLLLLSSSHAFLSLSPPPSLLPILSLSISVARDPVAASFVDCTQPVAVAGTGRGDAGESAVVAGSGFHLVAEKDNLRSVLPEKGTSVLDLVSTAVVVAAAVVVESRTVVAGIDRSREEGPKSS